LTIVLVGLSHRTAPVSLRERLSNALDKTGCEDGAITGVSSFLSSGFREAVLLSTCNRLEIYAVPTCGAGDACELIVECLAQAGAVTRTELEPHIYHEQDADAVRHLLRVASGLDSQLLGETQILGQVSQAFASARAEGTSGAVLTYLFSRAVHAGKRARTETDISRGNTSISHAAVDLLEKQLGDLGARSILVLGAGETAELAVQALLKHGATNVCCINRTLSSAQELAARLGCHARPWGELAAALAVSDAVITATGSPHPVIYADDVGPTLAQREGTPLVFVDIAVPRDVDLEVASLPGVVLEDIDRLEAALDHNLSRRSAAVPEVEEIISSETQRVMDWLHGREATALVAELRENAASVVDAEVAAALRKLGHNGSNAEAVVSRMANRIVGKLLHEPTRQLKSRASSGDFDVYCQAMVDLFGLDPACLVPKDRPRHTPPEEGGKD
jgi:glutamyl-tRNA reductase